MSGRGARDVKRRDEKFVQRIATRIWQEEASADNPYLAATARCHGYELTELMRRCSYVQVLYLLFRGELPTPRDAQLFERLAVGLINPGPRHPAVRAAMVAGVGKTDPGHMLPIGLLALGGGHLGAGEIEPAMRFLRKMSARPAADAAAEVLGVMPAEAEPDHHPVAGFGRRFGGPDVLAGKVADELVALAGEASVLAWAARFVEALGSHGMGWLTTGVAAAAFCDLGFMPRVGPGLFQLLCAPGLLAHGVELANKPVTAFPFIPDDNYIIEDGQH